MRWYHLTKKSIVMKKLATILTAAVFLISASAFSTDSDKVNAKIKSAFLEDFSGAQAINWQKTNDFYFATFMLNNKEINAAYNEDGDLIGTSRFVEASMLPLSVSLAISKKYEGYSLSDKALELTYDGETRYYLTIRNETQALKLKCLSNGSLTVEKKFKNG